MPTMQQEKANVKVGFERVMVATDLTATSERAVEYGKALAHASGATLNLVFVHDPSKVYSYEEAVLGLPAVKGPSRYEEALDSLQRSCAQSGLSAWATTVEGHSPSSELLRMTREHRVDLVVMGTQSKHGFERLLLGSTAERLIRESDCPVLTVGPKVESPGPGPLAFNRILFATDFSDEAAKAAAYALSFAEESGAKLTCCYVRMLKDKDQDSGELIDAAFERALRKLVPESSYDWCCPEFVVEHGVAAGAILKVAEEKHADLIVMGARRPAFWLKRHGVGISPSILAEAKCPVLTCTEKCD